jgi:DNA modification methylase
MKQTPFRWKEDVFDVEGFFNSGKLPVAPVFSTNLGALFSADCMTLLPAIASESIDTVFADPPFNLGKKYGHNTDDLKPDAEYLNWSRKWISECVRILKPGGAFFLYNLPKWNVIFGAYLMELGMDFKHWIAVEISSSYPIPGRLHPSHYGLLYCTKGKAKTFRRIRIPIQTCRHCGGEIKDYGGHRHAMNPRGVNLKDVWTDIPPVRHWKFKSKDRRANALSSKILDRIVEISTHPGEVVFDPFGGSGTTYAVCEAKQRRWIGIEIDFAREIAERLESGHVQPHKNHDYVED